MFAIRKHVHPDNAKCLPGKCLEKSLQLMQPQLTHLLHLGRWSWLCCLLPALRAQVSSNSSPSMQMGILSLPSSSGTGWLLPQKEVCHWPKHDILSPSFVQDLVLVPKALLQSLKMHSNWKYTITTATLDPQIGNACLKGILPFCQIVDIFTSHGHLVFSLSHKEPSISRTEKAAEGSKNRDSFRGALKIEEERGRGREWGSSPASVYWITAEVCYSDTLGNGQKVSL